MIKHYFKKHVEEELEEIAFGIQDLKDDRDSLKSGKCAATNQED